MPIKRFIFELYIIIFLFTFCIDTGSFKVVHIGVELTPTQRGLGLLPTFLPESPE